MKRSNEKKCFALLEIILATCLIALFLGFLFKTYFQFQLLNSQVERVRQIVIDRQKTQLKLSRIFLNLKQYAFTPEGLMLEYNNSLDRDKKFRGVCTSLVHLQNKLLILTTWNNTPPSRQEILLELNSKAPILKFEFFDPQKKTFITPDVKTPLMDSPLLVLSIDDIQFPLSLKKANQ